MEIRGGSEWWRWRRAFAAAELGAGEAGAGAEELEEGGAGVHVPLTELHALAVDREDRRRGGGRSEGSSSHRGRWTGEMRAAGACRNRIPIWAAHPAACLSTTTPTPPSANSRSLAASRRRGRCRPVAEKFQAGENERTSRR
jgi:hypothetical protein